MKYQCDIKFMAVPNRMHNVVKQCASLSLSYTDVAVDSDLSGCPLKTSQSAFSLPVKHGVTHRLVLQDDLILNPYLMESIQVLVNRFPDHPIALYTYKRKEMIPKGIYRLYFLPGPAIIMPLNIMKGITDEYKKYPLFKHDDWFYSWYCRRNNIKMIGVLPNLVTLDERMESVLSHRPHIYYTTSNYSENRVDVGVLPDETQTYVGEYINISDREFNKIYDYVSRCSNTSKDRQ